MKLAQLLVENSCLDRVFFCNSGAEAIEAAIKLARKHGYKTRGPEKHEVVSALNSFHGRTFGALAATGQPKYHQGFQPLPAGFFHVPFNDVDALTRAVTARTCAVLLEPILGESGVYPATPEFLGAARRLCDANGFGWSGALGRRRGLSCRRRSPLDLFRVEKLNVEAANEWPRAFDAVFFPLVQTQFPFDKNPPALFEILCAGLGEFLKRVNADEKCFFPQFLIPIAELLRNRNVKRGHRQPGGQVAHFRVARQIADQEDPIQHGTLLFPPASAG
jgi:hypothetical protein